MATEMNVEDIQSHLQDHTGVDQNNVPEVDDECLGKEVCSLCRSEYQSYDRDLYSTCLACAAKMDEKRNTMAGNLLYI